MVLILCPFLYTCPLSWNLYACLFQWYKPGDLFDQWNVSVCNRGRISKALEWLGLLSLLLPASSVRRACLGQPSGPEGRWKKCIWESSSPELSLDQLLSPPPLSWPEMHEWAQGRLARSLHKVWPKSADRKTIYSNDIFDSTLCCPCILTGDPNSHLLTLFCLLVTYLYGFQCFVVCLVKFSVLKTKLFPLSSQRPPGVVIHYPNCARVETF